MIKISIPNNNILERKYIIEIVFNEFLGLSYQIFTGSKEYEFTLLNKKKLVIKDTFFNKYPEDLTYLKRENIPENIYELDVFALTFFMLTRWEEYVNPVRDEHNRFPATASLAFKQGFLDRPIVDEELEKFKQKLFALDPSLQFKMKPFTLVLTHDVDEVRFWKSKKQLIHIVIGDLFKRKNILLALNRLKEYYFVSKNKIKDPFDTFDWLMDKSESIGLKSRFYFISGGTSDYDNRYDIKQQTQLIQHIKRRGHIVGIHPSYNAYNDFEQFKKEKELLEEVCECEVEEGREHYLRFEVPTTWQVWEDNGMKVDSTCGYADKVGFRCGTGNEFSVFNILTRKKLKLKERPLILMDCTLFTYNNLNYIEALKKLEMLKNRTNMLTLLWHNSYIAHIKFYGELFEKSSINSFKQL